jgi:uncharacterized protein YceK
MRTTTATRPGSPVRIVATLAIALGVLASSGCMTLDHIVDPAQPLAMYGGTTSSYAYIEDASSPFFGTLIRIIDLPATLVGDTVLLPISAPVEGLR